MAEQPRTEEQPRPQATAAGPKPPAHMEALADMVSAASALKLIQDQANLDAMRLPDKRLDDAGPDGGAAPYTLRDAGDGTFTKVNADGSEYNAKKDGEAP